MFTYFLFAFSLAFLIHAYNPKYKLVRPVHEFYLNKVLLNNRLSRNNFKQMDSFLEKNVPFYAMLSLAGRAKFIHRLEKLILLKSFKPMGELKLKEEHKWLACSGGVILTFGLKNYTFNQVKLIEIHPSIFYNSLLEKYLKGAAGKHKIMFALDYVEEGFSKADDGLNLALHEFAHAFEIELKKAGKGDPRYVSYQDILGDIASDSFNSFKTEMNDSLRAYAGTNEFEFFAVCIEHFFENPQKLFRAFPNLFVHLAVALNLNPLNAQNDFRLTQDFIDASNKDQSTHTIPNKLSKFVLNSNYKWPQYAIVLGFFFSLPIAILSYVEFNAKPISFGLMWFFAAASAYFFGYRKYILSKYMVPLSLGIYSGIGIAPITMAVFLMLNMFWVRAENISHKWIRITGVNERSGNISVSTADGLPYYSGIENPLYVGSLEIQKLQMDKGDSVKVQFMYENHLPGWVIAKGAHVLEFKRSE